MSTSGASAVTFTVSATFATLSVAASFAVWPTRSVTPSWLIVAKPESSNFTV